MVDFMSSAASALLNEAGERAQLFYDRGKRGLMAEPPALSKVAARGDLWQGSRSLYLVRLVAMTAKIRREFGVVPFCQTEMSSGHTLRLSRIHGRLLPKS